MSSDLGLQFLDLRVKSPYFNFVLLGVSLNVNADLRFGSQRAHFIGETGYLTSEWIDDSFFILKGIDVRLAGLPFNVSLLQQLVLSFDLSECTLESQEITISSVDISQNGNWFFDVDLPDVTFQNALNVS